MNLALKICSAFCFLGAALSFAGEQKDYATEVKQIETNFQQALTLHAEGKFDEASTVISDTYFEVFEHMETDIGARSASLKTQLEGDFSDLRTSLGKGAAHESVSAKAESLEKRIKAAAFQLKEDESWWDKFVSSFFVIVREGFEAILIVGAITAFLLKTKNKDLLYLIKSASLTAIAASFVLAALFQLVFHVTAAQQELFEGVTMLLACGVLFVVGHWLISQAESQHWVKYVKSQIDGALSGSSRKTIWMTCFLAVFREGAETVLFYQALWSSTGPTTKSSVVAGFLVGSVVLAIIFLVYKKSAVRIPMKPFFRVTSALLYSLSVTIAGKAIVELQAGGYLSVTSLESLPAVPWLGFYPTLEHVLFQGLLVAALVVSVTWVFWTSKRQEKLEKLQKLELEGSL